MLVKKSSSQQNKGKLVHMSFVVSEDLRNTFKAKVSAKGKKMQEVLESLMKEYIKK